MLPVFVLVSTSGNKATNNFGGAEFVIGLAIAYGLLSTSLIGYALRSHFARRREWPAALSAFPVVRLRTTAGVRAFLTQARRREGGGA